MDNKISVAKEKLSLDDAGLAARLGVHRTTVLRMEQRGEVSGPTSILLDKLLAEAPPHKRKGKPQ